MNLPNPDLVIGGWAALGGNFYGPGNNGKISMRATTPVDFSAHLHDILFVVNELNWSDSPYKDPAMQSRLSKSNYIFNILNSSVRYHSLPDTIIEAISKIVLPFNKKDWIDGDGFQNILMAEELQSPEYLMIPYSELSEKSKASLMEKVWSEDFDGIGMTGMGGYKKVINYNKAVKEDCFDWRKWAESYFGDAWWQACEVE